MLRKKVALSSENNTTRRSGRLYGSSFMDKVFLEAQSYQVDHVITRTRITRAECCWENNVCKRVSHKRVFIKHPLCVCVCVCVRTKCVCVFSSLALGYSSSSSSSSGNFSPSLYATFLIQPSVPFIPWIKPPHFHNHKSPANHVLDKS